MKIKHPLVLLAAAVLIAITVIVIENPMRSRVDDVDDGMLIPGFDSAEVERVEVSQLIDGVTLKRDGDRWLVSESVTPLKADLIEKEGRERPAERWVRASRTRINSALGNFSGLEEGVIISSKEEKRPLYQVDATGVLVKLVGRDGKVIEDIVIGKNGPDLASTYIRRADENEVRLVKKPFVGAFSPAFSDWREMRLWSLAPDQIESIAVESEGGSFEIKRGDEGASAIMTKLSHASAEGFPEDPDIELGSIKEIVRLKVADGQELVLTIHARLADGRFPARLAGVDETYLISEEFVDSIPKKKPEGSE